MSSWKILVADRLDPKGIEILRANAQVHDCPGISGSELRAIIADYDALIVRSRTLVDAGVIAQAGRLRVIGRAGVGVDNIDIQAARSQGVIVVNAPEASTVAVAELTMGFMLSVARRIPGADLSIKRGVWDKKAFVGQELHEKTLGIIGIGQIGRTVAAYASALGMRVIAYDPMLSPELIQQRAARPVQLEQLFSESDFITLHAPLNESTRHIINPQTLEMMKPGVFILCAARGGLIDEEALLEALESGKVAGAALDVFAQEPPGHSPLAAHPNVVATPHIGAQTLEAQKHVSAEIAGEVLAALSGDPLRWQVA